jgi:hypothetical protein
MLVDPIYEAGQAKWFGAEFVARARTVASNFDVPVEWLLATISWETGDYTAYLGPDKVSAAGLHWAVNGDPKDAGGGLFGWPHYASLTDRNWKNPVQQLDDVDSYLRSWKKTVKIDDYKSPTDFYLTIRGPWALAKQNYNNDNFNMGVVLVDKVRNIRKVITLGEVRKIYWNRVNTQYGWTPTDYPGIDNTNNTYFLSWVPTKSVAKTTSALVPVRSGPTTTYRVTRTVILLGTPISCLGKVTGESVNGNTDWVMVGTNEYISGTQLLF